MAEEALFKALSNLNIRIQNLILAALEEDS